MQDRGRNELEEFLSEERGEVMNAELGFKKAEKKLASLKIAITGPSGSGKTFSALRLASGIGKKIAVIDTENSSACLYSDRFAFDVFEIEPPYTIDKYLFALSIAEKNHYDVLIMDSITHAWAEEGGLLDKKQALDSRGSGSSYTNWASITKEQNIFKSKILYSNLHTICTMRSKQDYVLEMNDKGKSVPKKVGMAPIQRDGMEYEFTVVFDLGMDHQAIVSKDRTGLFDGKIFTPTEKTGETLMSWLGGAKALPAMLSPTPPPQALESKPSTPQTAPQQPKVNGTARHGGANDYVVMGGPYTGKRLGDVNLEELMRYNEKLKKSLQGVAHPHAHAIELVMKIEALSQESSPKTP